MPPLKVICSPMPGRPKSSRSVYQLQKSFSTPRSEKSWMNRCLLNRLHLFAIVRWPGCQPLLLGKKKINLCPFTLTGGPHPSRSERRLQRPSPLSGAANAVRNARMNGLTVFPSGEKAFVHAFALESFKMLGGGPSRRLHDSARRIDYRNLRTHHVLGCDLQAFDTASLIRLVSKLEKLERR